LCHYCHYGSKQEIKLNNLESKYHNNCTHNRNENEKIICENKLNISQVDKKNLKVHFFMFINNVLEFENGYINN
jgi:hypothetical protein